MRYVPLIALLVSSSALIVAWLNYSKTRELNCTSESSCLSSSFRIAELDINLQAAYKGRVIDDICFTRLHFSCAGEIPIEASEFNGQPIVVELGSDCNIIEVHLENSEGQKVHPILNSDTSSLTIEPLLLNPGDAFSIYLVTTGGAPRLNVSGRITGVSEIGSTSTLKTPPRPEIAKWLMVVIAFCASTFFFSITAKGVYHGNPIKQSVVFLPKRSFSIWLLALSALPVFGILVATHFISRELFLPIMVATQVGMMTSMLTLMFNGSRWVVYKEVADEEERFRLSSSYL